MKYMHIRPSVRIYMKPYLVEFAKCMIGNNRFANQYLIIKLIKPFLRRGVPQGRPWKPPSHLACIEIPLPLISDLYIADNKVYIHHRDMLNISRILQAHFDSILFFYMHDKIRYTRELKKCINQFIADLDISPECVNYDMLKKKYYRFSTKKQLKKNFISSFPVPDLSLTLPFMI